MKPSSGMLDSNTNRSVSHPASSTNPISADNDLDLRLYSASEQPFVLERWAELEDRLGGSPLACSVAWTRTWLRHYVNSSNGNILRPWFVVGTANGRVAGICLLTQSQTQHVGPWQICSLHLGTAGEQHGTSACVEHNDILVEPEYRNTFIRKLQRLIESEPGWDQFQLDGIPVNGNLSWPMFNDERRDVGHLQISETKVRVRECRYFDLEQARQAGGDILAKLGKSTRSNLRRRLRQVGEVEVEWADSVSQAEDIFQELVALHQARWQAVGQPGAFASESFLNFQRELISTLIPTQQVTLVRVKANQLTVGCLYLLNDRNRLLDYVSGFVSFEEFPSPGLISHYLCMQQALERRYDAYDFLVGEKRHKENLGKSSQQLQWVVCERHRTCFQLRQWAITAKNSIKKVIRRK